MKKLYLLLGIIITSLSTTLAQTICTIDPQAQTTPGISPSPDQLPCVVAGENYNQIIQVQNLNNLQGVVTVDSMILDSIIGLPQGLNWIKNPNVLARSANGCLTFFGVTNAPAGQYQLKWYGTVWATAPVVGSRTYTGNLSQFSSAYNYYLNVINPGDQCRSVTAVNDFSTELNSAMYILPNPNNGLFEFSLDAGKRITGELAVFDVTGKKVFSQQLDAIGLYTTSIDLSKFAKGLYILRLQTPDGAASKRVSVE
jgi:hypothetical protein